jgi:WD40 repeat protein
MTDNKLTILFLAANTHTAPALEIDVEYKAIKDALQRSTFKDRFDLRYVPARQYKDWLEALREHDPYVIHFSGIGTQGSELLLVEENGDPRPIGPTSLPPLFDYLKGNVRCVVFNACHSAELAAAVAQVVGCAVGMRGPISDSRALDFSRGFYSGLGAGRSIQQAFDLGRAAIGDSEREVPQLQPETGPTIAFVLVDAGGVRKLPPMRMRYERNHAFVGREEELRELHAALTSRSLAGIQPAGLAGLGGVGKTQLAIEYCYRYLDCYPGGIFWLDAAGDWSDEFAALGLYLNPDLDDKNQRRCLNEAARYLAGRADCLLVFDNAPDAKQLGNGKLLGLPISALGCRILLTSRRRNLTNMHVIQVLPLPEEQAMKLLLRSKSRLAVLDPTHPEHGEAKRICAILGNLPLALEIAGAHLGNRPQLALGLYCQHLLNRGALLAIEEAHGDPFIEDHGIRHEQGMAATLAEQWDAVDSADARLLLRIAGQLPLGSDIPLAQLALLMGSSESSGGIHRSSIEKALEQVSRWSLVEDLSQPDVRLHPLIHEFARTQTPDADLPAFRRECAGRLLARYQDVAELQRQYAARGIGAIEHDLLTTQDLLSSDQHSVSQLELRQVLRDLLRMVKHESHLLWSMDRTQELTRFLQQWHKRAVISRNALHAEAAGREMTRLALSHLLLLWTTSRDSADLERTLSGHRSAVRAFAAAPDGSLLVSASEDGILKVWDLEAGRVLHTLDAHADWVHAVAVTADKQQAVSAGGDRLVKVWDLQRGQELHTLAGHTGWVIAVALTHTGQVVSASRDKTLKVWDLANGELLHTLAGHTGWVTAIAVTGDGKRALSGAADHTLKLWNLQDGRTLCTLQGHSHPITAVALTRNSRWAVSASKDGTLKVWNLETGRELHTLTGHASGVTAVALTPDGNRAISASVDSTLKVWDLHTGQELRTLTGHADEVRVVSILAGGQQVVSGSLDRALKLWDIESGRVLNTLDGHTDWVTGLIVTPAGRAISASRDKTLKVWQLLQGQEVHTFSGHSHRVTDLVVTPDNQAVSASRDRTIQVWDVATGTKRHTLYGHSDWVTAVAVVGQRVVSASKDSTLKVWDLQTGQELYTLAGHTDVVNTIAITPDGSRAISASDDYTVRVWNLRSGEELSTLSHAGPVNDVAVTPDGRRAVSASDDSNLKVWDIGTGAELYKLGDDTVSLPASGGSQDVQPTDSRALGHTTWVSSVAVTPDGKHAVSGSWDHTLRVWDLSNGRELHVLSGHTKGITAVAITQDGRHAVSTSDDDTVKVWNIAAGHEVCTLNSLTARESDTNSNWLVTALMETSDTMLGVSGLADGALKVWDLLSGHHLAGLVFDSVPYAVAEAHQGNIVVVGDAAGNVHCLRYCEAKIDAADADAR